MWHMEVTDAVATRSTTFVLLPANVQLLASKLDAYTSFFGPDAL